MAITTAARQQVQEEQVMRIASYIMETHYGYISHSAVVALNRCEDAAPEELTKSELKAREIERKRCRLAFSAAREIRQYMTGEIE